MSVNTDSTTSGIPVRVSFTGHAASCLPPSMVDAIRNANFRIDLPQTTTGSGTLLASTLADNITRIDSQGAIYTPGIIKVPLSEQIITLTTTTAPGVPVEMGFDAPSVSDLENTLSDFNFDIQPPESFVREGPKRFVAGRILFNFYRLDDGSSSPYPEVVIRGSGRLFVIPSPSPA